MSALAVPNAGFTVLMGRMQAAAARYLEQAWPVRLTQYHLDRLASALSDWTMDTHAGNEMVYMCIGEEHTFDGGYVKVPSYVPGHLLLDVSLTLQ